MQVGILGSGDVGQRLGSAFLELGNEVKLGTRDPNKEEVQAWLAQHGARASVGTFDEVASYGEIVVLATAWSGTENALHLAKPGNLRGKVVIDVTNPLDFSQGMPPRLALGHTDSGGEQVQRWLPDARVVKAFNIVGNQLMFRPSFPGGPPTMFYCGNDEGAKATVADLLRRFGWDASDLGGIDASRYIEPLAMVWVLHGFQTDTWDHALKLLRK